MHHNKKRAALEYFKHLESEKSDYRNYGYIDKREDVDKFEVTWAQVDFKREDEEADDKEKFAKREDEGEEEEEEEVNKRKDEEGDDEEMVEKRADEEADA